MNIIPSFHFTFQQRNSISHIQQDMVVPVHRCLCQTTAGHTYCSSREPGGERTGGRADSATISYILKLDDPVFYTPGGTVPGTEGPIHKEWIAAVDSTMNRVSQ